MLHWAQTAQPWYPDKSTALCDLTSDWYLPSPPNKICSLIPRCAWTRELFFICDFLIYQCSWKVMLLVWEAGRQTHYFFPLFKDSPSSMAAGCLTLTGPAWGAAAAAFGAEGQGRSVQGDLSREFKAGRGNTDQGWKASWRKSETTSFRDSRKKDFS